MPQQHVAVIGAGMLGLSTAWFLQEHGIRVTVYDRDHVAAGSSWGNAGWLTPALTAPLPEPSVLKYGIKAVLSPSSPVYVPLRADLKLLRFLAGFTRHSTARQWQAGMRAYAPMNKLALDAFEQLTDADVAAPTQAADPFLACFRNPDEHATLVDELEHIRSAGQDVKYDILTGHEARAAEPALSAQVGSAVRLHGQRYLNPPAFMAALAAAVCARGGEIIENTAVTDILHRGDGIRLVTHPQHSTPATVGQAVITDRFDTAVIANGAWLSPMARKFGVHHRVQAGRGYSFSVAADRVPAGPVYFPTQRVACTPLHTPQGTRLRVAGMMEFRAPDAALDHRRIKAIVNATQPLLDGVNLHDRADEWVGSRPCTADGLPLIGATTAPGVFVAGGHGMWGIALGPLSGKLLARRIATGITPPELAAFDPLR